MAGVVSKSGLFNKVKDKAKTVHGAAAAKPVVVNAGLPAGIDNGVARLVDMHFGEYKDGENKGKLYFMAAGVVIEPKDHDGVPVEGQRTQIGPLPLCDTPKSQGKRKTFQDNYDYFLNELKKFEACPATVDLVESTVAQLVKIAPYFRFRTWKGKPSALFPNPRVNHSWEGIIANYKPGEAASGGGGVVDNTVATGAGDADGALTELAALADSGDEAANLKLQDSAKQHGLTEDDLADTTRFPNWKTVVEVITGAAIAPVSEGEESGGEEGSDEGTDESEGSETSGPSVGDRVKYQPLDPKDKAKKKRLAAVECEIVSIDEEKQTLALKNGKTTYKGVKVEMVEPV